MVNAKMNHRELEAELIGLSGADTVDEAVRVLGLLPPDAEQFVVRLTTGWTRGGAETYVMCFEVDTSISTHRFMLKACVAFPAGRSIDAILEQWISRRRLLSSLSICTPRLFGHGNGIMLEDFVGIPIADGLASMETPHLIESLSHLAAAYSSLGFDPIDGFSDLRVDGRDIYVIDFGEDLGPPRRVPKGQRGILRQMDDHLRRWHIPLSEANTRLRDSIFDSWLSRLTDR